MAKSQSHHSGPIDRSGVTMDATLKSDLQHVVYVWRNRQTALAQNGYVKINENLSTRIELAEKLIKLLV